MSGADTDVPLPGLREDLVLRRGASDSNGEPGWLIYDPVPHRYIRINAATCQLLSLWPYHATTGSLLAAARGAFGIDVSREELLGLIAFLHANYLTNAPGRGAWRSYARAAARLEDGRALRRWQSMLFHRVPLLRPERFLRSTLPLVAPLYSRAAAIIVAVMALAGAYLVSRQWDEFLTTFDAAFSLDGLLVMMLALVTVKALHELGHAYTAVRAGCAVPTIGVAFVFGMPMPFTDVTDAWRLRCRADRLWIDAAGMIAEVGVAVVATLAWVFLPDGPARSAAFMLATVGWVMSLAVNLNPFMRFDGYYLLSEWSGVENLQARAFAVGRWRLREVLFAFGEPCPERRLPRPSLLAAYASGVWIYRAMVLFGVALLAYAHLFKALGLLVAIFAVWTLILAPMLREMRAWWAMRERIARSGRALVTASILVLGAAACIVPWSTRITIPVVLEHAQLATVFAARPGRVAQVSVPIGRHVAAGDVLVRLEAPDLDREQRVFESKLALVEARLARGAADSADLQETVVLQHERAALRSRLAGIARERQELTIRAPIAGRVVETNATLVPGRWVGPRETLAMIGGDGGELAAIGYLREEDARRVTTGATGRFIPDQIDRPALGVRLTRLSPAAVTFVDRAALASTNGGHVAVRQGSDGRLVPVEAQILVGFASIEPSDRVERSIRGVVHLSGAAESLLGRVWRRIVRVALRESGF